MSVVVPTYQRRERAVGLLQALASQDTDFAELEVVVAIDGSTDGTRPALEGLALPYLLRIAEQVNRGRAAARNLGVAHSRGPILLFLDDDMEPEPGLLRAHRSAHEGAEATIAIGPVPIRVDDSARPLQRYRATTFSARFERLCRPGVTPLVTDACMGNLSVKRRLFDAAGGFDEQFRGYGLEDFELVLRMVQRGGSLRFVAGAVARQHYDKTLAELAGDIEDEGANSVRLARKHPEMLRALELGSWTARSRRHRRALTALLRATLRVPALRRAMLAAGAATLHLRTAAATRSLDHIFDYFYWLGVCRADEGPGVALRRGTDMEHALRSAELLPDPKSAERDGADAR